MLGLRFNSGVPDADVDRVGLRLRVRQLLIRVGAVADHHVRIHLRVPFEGRPVRNGRRRVQLAAREAVVVLDELLPLEHVDVILVREELDDLLTLCFIFNRLDRGNAGEPMQEVLVATIDVAFQAVGRDDPGGVAVSREEHVRHHVVFEEFIRKLVGDTGRDLLQVAALRPDSAVEL